MTDKERLLFIGKKIECLRNSRNLKQYQLAEMCNFEKAGMSRIESGKVNIPILTLLKISNALDVSIIELLDYCCQAKDKNGKGVQTMARAN